MRRAKSERKREREAEDTQQLECVTETDVCTTKTQQRAGLQAYSTPPSIVRIIIWVGHDTSRVVCIRANMCVHASSLPSIRFIAEKQ